MVSPFPNFPGRGQPPFGTPPFGPPGGRPSSNAPMGPPPSRIPAQPQGVGLYAVDPGAIRRCLYNYTYVWLRNGRSFWFYPTYVGRESIAGYRWNGWRWAYYGTDLQRISSFQC